MSRQKKSIIRDRAEVIFYLKVRGYEELKIDKVLEEDRIYEFEKKHFIVYSSDKFSYNVENVGLKVMLSFFKISEQRAFVDIMIYYDYLMGWNKEKGKEIPIIDRKSKNINKKVYIGDFKEFKGLELGNRIIDCKIKIGYNNLIIKKMGR